MELAPTRTTGPGGHPYDERNMTRQEIEAALGQVAASLAKRRQNVGIVEVGICIKTILLGTRSVTHDVDFFAESRTHPARKSTDTGHFAKHSDEIQPSPRQRLVE